MTKMKAPYTGVLVEVAEARVQTRLAAGFVLVGEYVPPVVVFEAPKVELPEVPTDESTVAEIKAYLTAAGIDAPKKATKAELLALCR